MRKLIALLALLISLSPLAKAQSSVNVIATNRSYDWADNAGAPGGSLPSASYTQCGSTITTTSASAASVTAQIATCSANQYVLMGPGTSPNLTTCINWAGKNQVELRGSGANSTFLVFTGGCSCGGQTVMMCLAAPGGSCATCGATSVNWTAGYSQGATAITVSDLSNITANSTQLFLDGCNTGYTGSTCTGTATDNGGYFECGDQYVSTTVGCSDSGNDAGFARPERFQTEGFEATSCSPTCGTSGSGTVNLSSPLGHAQWASVNNTQVWLSASERYVGVQNLSINGAGTSSATIAMEFFNDSHAWVSGVRCINTVISCVNGAQDLYMLVKDNYFYNVEQGNGLNDSSAIRLSGSHMLIQNNICEKSRVCVNYEGPCFDCVRSYNFSVNQEYPADAMFAAYFSHSQGDDFDLDEGNVGNELQLDTVHGGHLNNASFRNLYLGWESCANGQCGSDTFKDFGTNAMGGMRAYNRYGIVVGDVLGTPPYHTSYADTNTPPSNTAVFLKGTGNAADSPPLPTDSLTMPTAVVYGNWDVVTNAVRWCGNSSNTGWVSICGSVSEVGTSAPTYPNSVPSVGDTGSGQGALQPSFYLASKPAWFGSHTYPPIGPDVTGGNVSYCSGTINTPGEYAGVPASSSGQCTGTSLVSGGFGGHVMLIPSMDCFLNTMGGKPDGTDSAALTFNPSACYASSGSVTLTPSSENFGSVNVGSSSSPVTFTLANNSSTTATSISPSVTGGNSGDFSVTNTGAGSCSAAGNSIAASASCTITGTFSPTAAGARSTTLSVSYSGGDSASPQTSALSGTGVSVAAVGTVVNGGGVCRGGCVIH